MKLIIKVLKYTFCAIAGLALGNVIASSILKVLPNNSFPQYAAYAPSADISAVQSNSNKKPNFTIAVVCGGHVNCARGIKPLQNAIKYISSKVDATFEINKIILSDATPEGTIEERWSKWLEIAAKLGAIKSDLAVIVLEDFPDNVDQFDFEQEGMVGLASGIGVLGVQPSALLVKVMGGEKFMTRIITHEIGHVLGAHHIEEGIMHPCACVNQYSDEYSLNSIAEIKAHLENLKVLKLIRALAPSVTATPNSTPITPPDASQKPIVELWDDRANPLCA